METAIVARKSDLRWIILGEFWEIFGGVMLIIDSALLSRGE
jgi:hypothetical protein